MQHRQTTRLPTRGSSSLSTRTNYAEVKLKIQVAADSNSLPNVSAEHQSETLPLKEIRGGGGRRKEVEQRQVKSETTGRKTDG